MAGRGAAASPALSVIVPAYNAERTLDRCLAAIRASDVSGYELVVVDDGSTDATAHIAARFAPDRLITHARREGAWVARNRGATEARGEVLFFTDADVAVRPDTLSRTWRHVAGGGCDAVIGIYDDGAPDAGLCTTYKNAWIRASHLACPDEIEWFFTAVGAVRRAVWERVGRFDERFDVRTGGGDIEFGRRLARAGYVVRSDKSIEVRHMKVFTLPALLTNDACRAWGYARLGLRTAPPLRAARRGIGNVSPRFIASTGAVAAAAATAFVPPLWPVCATAAAAHVVASAPFLRFVARRRGWPTAVACVPLGALDQLCAAAGAGAAVIMRNHFTK